MGNQKHILLGVCSSVAAYKTLEFVRLLRKNNYKITCLLSEHAKLFVTKESFLEEIQNQQSDILDFIKEKHFQLFMKSLSIIQKALENDDISLKDKAMISTRYLSLCSGYLINNINKASYHLKENSSFNF